MAGKTMGERICEVREMRGFSASDLARLTGVTPTAVWNWEKNGIKPRPPALAALSRSLGVSEEYLLTGWGPPPQNTKLSPPGEWTTSPIVHPRPLPPQEATVHEPSKSVDEILTSATIEIAAKIGIAKDRVKLRFEVV
jgi:transcriptional regulator with XRE-family HTH domain